MPYLTCKSRRAQMSFSRISHATQAYVGSRARYNARCGIAPDQKRAHHAGGADLYLSAMSRRTRAVEKTSPHAAVRALPPRAGAGASGTPIVRTGRALVPAIGGFLRNHPWRLPAHSSLVRCCLVVQASVWSNKREEAGNVNDGNSGQVCCKMDRTEVI